MGLLSFFDFYIPGKSLELEISGFNRIEKSIEKLPRFFDVI